MFKIAALILSLVSGVIGLVIAALSLAAALAP